MPHYTRVGQGFLLVLLLAILIFGWTQLSRSKAMRPASPDDSLPTSSPVNLHNIPSSTSSYTPTSASPQDTRSLPSLLDESVTASPLDNPSDEPTLALPIQPSPVASSTTVLPSVLGAPSLSPVVTDSLKYDVSPPLRDIEPIPPKPEELREIPLYPLPNRQETK